MARLLLELAAEELEVYFLAAMATIRQLQTANQDLRTRLAQ